MTGEGVGKGGVRGEGGRERTGVSTGDLILRISTPGNDLPVTSLDNFFPCNR